MANHQAQDKPNRSPTWRVEIHLVRYGIPEQMHTENGSPFGSVRAIQRFTQRSYWFIELGIVPVLFVPAHPDQKG
jgi:hypothetical protein